jgi:transcriptional regulator with XRE-family HTH domain
MKLGRKIKRLRKMKNLTTRELGELVGCSYSAISQYENNQRLPGLIHFKNMCKVFGVKYELFLDETEEEVTILAKRDKFWIDRLVEDKGERYQVIVDNDSAWVEDKERDFEPVYNFQEYGHELALVLFQYVGIKAKMC